MIKNFKVIIKVTELSNGNRVVISTAAGKSLELEINDETLILQENGEVRLLSKRKAVRQARKIVRGFVVSAKRSLADDLLSERKLEPRII